jgi:hypothetical protein
MDVPLPTTMQPTPAKKASFFRNTRFQTGSLQLLVRGAGGSGGPVMRPAMNMNVEWMLPQSEVNALATQRAEGSGGGGGGSKGGPQLVVGLVRYGSYTNSPCIVAKPINLAQCRITRRPDGAAICSGQLSFHTPKSAGQFVYRLFDQSTKESALTTLATSASFSVVLVDNDVATNLRHIMDALQEDSRVKGLSQFPSVLRGMRNMGKSGNAVMMLNFCVNFTLTAIADAHPQINTWLYRKAKLAAALPGSKDDISSKKNEK